MKTYKWRSCDWQDENEWSEIEAYDMENAAEKVGEKLYEVEPCANEFDLLVATIGLGKKKRFIVAPDYDISFSAREIFSQ